MNCTRDGAVVERVKTMMLRLLKNPLLAPFTITHTPIVSNCFCHDRFISEPAAIKIIWLHEHKLLRNKSEMDRYDHYIGFEH